VVPEDPVSPIHFSRIEMLHLLWLVPGLVALFLYASAQRKGALRRFADAGLLDRLSFSVNPVRRRWKQALLVATVVLCAIALARPGWNPEMRKVERSGRDVVFLLDVSRSMLAEDLKPNRMERSKLAVADCVDRLQGDRVALVAFAGTAAVKCPLTLDYGFFRTMLKDIGTDSISRGGTAIGDALRKAMDEVFTDREKQFKDLILITDGEDHDSFPVQAAEEAGKRGIRLLALGIGSETEGSRIPITDASGRRAFLSYRGQEIWSRLDGDTLRKMVNVTPGGKYLNVATGSIDLGQVYEQLVASADKRELESKTMTRYEEKFQVFLGLAFFLLCIELVLSERRTHRRDAESAEK
jgi:Ca-activated chloride channel homolog